MINQMEQAISSIRKKKPLILNLTNYVTMEFMANSLLAVGAAPLMSHCIEELSELIDIAKAININIGTIDSQFIARIQGVLSYAKLKNKPLILDPVGAGASKLRTRIAREFLPHIDIVRGNASEIIALVNDNHQTLGVESLSTTEQAEKTAVLLAKKYDITVIVSGSQDFITNGLEKITLISGSPLMALVTGMGCTLTAVIAAFNVVIADAFEASKTAALYYGLCGTLAANKTTAPGSFSKQFIDELYQANIAAMRTFYVE